ncbi:MAG: ABC transporter substrate-binding protein [Dehalococcoidia bacterium]|nr:ABC transporter substrate-binding protein [Dehalococcoidia bacterium]
MLQGSAIATAGLASAALFGCGGQGTKPADKGSAPAAGTAQGTTQKAKLLNEDMLALNEKDAPYPYIFKEPDTPPKRGGIFRDPWGFDIASLDPTAALSVTTNAVPNAVGERLVDFNEGARLNPFKIEIKPGLATSFEIAPDGMTITFRLTDKAKWHNKPPLNGRPFTSEDVRAVYERNRSTGVTKGSFDKVASISAPNPTTVVLKMKAPSPDFMVYAGAREGVIYPLELIDNGALAKATDAIGTGPFILTYIRRSEKITYVRNPDYWQPGKPYLDGAETKMVPDQSARLAGLRAGQFEVSQSPINNKRDADALKASNPEMNISWNVVDRGPVLLGSINLNNPHWKDERVRQAMTLGIDRERQLKILNDGYGTAYIRALPWPYVFDRRPTSQAELGPYLRYDPAEAKKLLAAAGYENTLKIDWHTSLQSTADSLINWAAANYKEIGVTVVPRIDQYINVQSTGYQKGFPDTSSFALVLITGDNFWKDMIQSTGPLNFTGINDPDIDKWADQQSVEINPQRRKEVLRKIWDRMGERSYRPMDGGAGGAPSGVWNSMVRNYWGGQAVNSFTCATEPVRHLKDVWIDKDNPSGRV